MVRNIYAFRDVSRLLQRVPADFQRWSQRNRSACIEIRLASRVAFHGAAKRLTGVRQASSSNST